MMIIFAKKLRGKFICSLIGALTFIVSARVLEQLLHMAVFMLFEDAVSNIWFYALYGGVAAAVFEEFARFFAMKKFMKDKLSKENALMYGVGHGGAESILLLGITYFSNIVTSLLINSGALEQSLKTLDPELYIQTFQQISPLWTSPAWMFYGAGLERALALILQISLSIFVFKAVKDKKPVYLCAALFTHFIVDAGVTLVYYYTGYGISLLVLAIIISAACSTAVILYRQSASGVENCESHESADTTVIAFRENPLFKNIYTADPAPSVYGDTLYLYTTHDEDELINDFYTMRDWRCFSTKDMVNWTDHGVIFSLDDIEWADDRAWAPQAIFRNGKYYLYCPVHKKDGGMAIAVGVSENPAGPFTDIGHPLVDEGDWNDIDPTVFIDDDGQAYLYFGNPELRYVLLNEDMISIDESVGVVKVPMTVESFGKGSHATGTTYGEGPWFYKRNGLYYMVFAGFAVDKKDEHLAYSTSVSPTGPWVYGGVLMTEEGGVFTNHPGVCDFKGHSYLFYHTGELPGGSLFHRSVCVAEFTYNEDGSINTIPKCIGVPAV
jgi:uncharacterized membrane protein YhfC